MAIKNLTNKETEAIKILESLQAFLEDKLDQKMPVFSDELQELWLKLETAMAILEAPDWD